MKLSAEQTQAIGTLIEQDTAGELSDERLTGVAGAVCPVQARMDRLRNARGQLEYEAALLEMSL